MKNRGHRLLAAGVVLLLSVSLAGCGGVARMMGAGPILLNDADNGTTIEVAGGKRVIVNLSANLSTGYSWVLASPGPVEQQGEPAYAEKEDPTGKVVGAGGTQTFEFIAKPSGSGELTLEYRRPWEADVPAEKTWSVPIEVK